MYYTYVLRAGKESRFYTGSTDDFYLLRGKDAPLFMKTIVFGVILSVLFFPIFQLSAQERVELSHDQLMPGLEYFIDGVAKSYMADKEIAGLQISIVKDNKVLFLKGYGIARLSPFRDVDPRQSLFRIGSISKTFTWISLMQLKERGKIKLTDPVNKFLPEPLLFSEEGFKKPILIIDLMNHTPGLEDLTQNIYVEKDEDLLSLVSYLAKYRPRRVREPGELTAYSNYGAALGGAIVANVTGKDFESYVEENILRPLGMNNTSFRTYYGPNAPGGLPSSMSKEMADRLAYCVEKRGGLWKEYQPLKLLSIAPSGSAVSTAEDMAKYMTALLDPQIMEQEGVLSRESVLELRQQSYSFMNNPSSIHHGFFNYNLGQTEKIGYFNFSHGGASIHFKSYMITVPELDLGIFSTSNSQSAESFGTHLVERIMTQYFPRANQQKPSMDELSNTSLNEFTGTYISLRRNYYGFEKLMALSNSIRISLKGNYLMYNGKDLLKQIGKDIFASIEGDRVINFHRDDNGKIDMLGGGIFIREKVGFLHTPQWLFMVVIVTVIICTGYITGWFRSIRIPPTLPKPQKYSLLLLRINSIFWLISFLMFIYSFSGIIGPDAARNFVILYPHTSLKIALFFILTSSILSLICIITLWPIWLSGKWSVWRKLRHSLAVGIYISLIFTLHSWNMVGFKYF